MSNKRSGEIRTDRGSLEGNGDFEKDGFRGCGWGKCQISESLREWEGAVGGTDTEESS